MEVTKLKTMSENPALEWNTKTQPEFVEGNVEVIFCPLVSHFDLRVVAAPAIVYEKGGQLDNCCQVRHMYFSFHWKDVQVPMVY